jgi:hypothetical protein
VFSVGLTFRSFVLVLVLEKQECGRIQKIENENENEDEDEDE